MVKVAVLAHTFRVVGLGRVLTLRRRLRVAFLVVAGATHVLGAMLLLHVLADESRAKLIGVVLLKGFAV